MRARRHAGQPIDELLQAQLAGTQVRFTSGQPGTASMIRSRGVISANSSTTPVVYVDGVRVDNLNTAASLNVATGGAQSSALPDIPLDVTVRVTDRIAGHEAVRAISFRVKDE